MSFIKNSIVQLNSQGKKALSIFLTAGYPQKDNFNNLVLEIIEAGADLIEIGIPFSDPLADGSIIQKSSQTALKNGVDLRWIFRSIEVIRKRTEIPIILMGYANPLLAYGIDSFITDSNSAGVNGLIIPDIPIDESDSVFRTGTGNLDLVQLTTPLTEESRIKRIDELSEGFVYCVSVSGTTGTKLNYDALLTKSLERNYNLITKNRMLIGFGISSAEDIEQMKLFADGFIVGSAIIKALDEDNSNFSNTKNLIRKLRKACDN